MAAICRPKELTPSAHSVPSLQIQEAPETADIGKAKTDIYEIMRSVRTVHVQGREAGLGIPAEPLEKELFGQPEFKSGGMLITKSRSNADLLIVLSRKPVT